MFRPRKVAVVEGTEGVATEGVVAAAVAVMAGVEAVVAVTVGVEVEAGMEAAVMAGVEVAMGVAAEAAVMAMAAVIVAAQARAPDTPAIPRPPLAAVAPTPSPVTIMASIGRVKWAMIVACMRQANRVTIAASTSAANRAMTNAPTESR